MLSNWQPSYEQKFCFDPYVLERFYTKNIEPLVDWLTSLGKISMILIQTGLMCQAESILFPAHWGIINYAAAVPFNIYAPMPRRLVPFVRRQQQRRAN